MNITLHHALARLRKSTDDFGKGQISSQEHAHQREDAVCTALKAIADELGSPLQGPVQIDAWGEISVVTTTPMGEELTTWLNSARPRCGQVGTVATLLPGHSTWCRIGHFAAESLVRRYGEMQLEVA